MLFTFRGGHLRDGESGGTPLPLLPLPYSSGADRDREPLVKPGGRPGAGCGRLGELLGRLAPPLPLPAPPPLADDREKPLPVIAGMVTLLCDAVKVNAACGRSCSGKRKTSPLQI